jgi:DeoR family transcriptional regulator of aga operon
MQSKDQTERWSEIIDRLMNAQSLGIPETAAALNVSEATIRRDFDQLAEQGLLRRVRGGAMPNNVLIQMPLRFRAARFTDEKERIARAAAELVEPGAIIGLTGGSTAAALVRTLIRRAEGMPNSPEPAFTIVTNALDIAYDLVSRPRFTVMVTGGIVRDQSFELFGSMATKLLEDRRFDLCFFSVDAINAQFGPTSRDEGEAVMGREMANCADRVIVIADGSKVGRHAFTRIVPLGQVDVLVTDRSAPEQAVRDIRAAGCDVICA